MAQAMAERAHTDDPKAEQVPQSGVGAVIANTGGLIAKSANVLPPRMKATMQARGENIPFADRYFVIEHAERAALFEAYRSGKDLTDATLYCTRFPCSDCARAIAWSPIKRVVFPTGFAGEQHWLEAQRAALRILRDSGVTIRYLGTAQERDETEDLRKS